MAAESTQHVVEKTFPVQVAIAIRTTAGLSFSMPTSLPF
jgi:hypothetical protein